MLRFLQNYSRTWMAKVERRDGGREYTYFQTQRLNLSTCICSSDRTLFILQKQWQGITVGLGMFFQGSQFVLILDHLIMIPFIGVLIILLTLKGKVPTSARRHVLPLLIPQIKAVILLYLDYLLIEFSFVDGGVESHRNIIPLHFEFIDIDLGHFVVLARLEWLAAVALFGLGLVHHYLYDYLNLMGNSEYREELRQYLPQMHNYTLKHCYSPLSIYRHLYNSEEIMEFKERVMNTQDIDRKVQTFLARYQHLYLVSSLFLKVEGNNNCGNMEYQLSIYYERVVTNLSKINEVSFKDSLHCLAVALKGFEILYKNYGHFEIFQNMFHICQRGKLKVWCNQNIYKNVPEQYLLGQGREEDMVVKIVNIIDQNTDQSCKVFPIRDAIVGLKKVTFSNAIVALRQICRENNFTISEHLESLENFSQFQSLLDIYSPPKRFPKDTLVTFYPKGGKSGRGTHRSNSNSSKTGQKVQGSERGKSAEVTVNPNKRFDLTIKQEENEFPRFVAGRQKNYSRSSSSSKSGKSNPKPTFKAYPQAQPTAAPHSHLQQFSRLNGESQLRKRNILQEPHHQNIRYTQQERMLQQPPQKPMVFLPQEQRVANNQHVYGTQVVVQRPVTPQQIQRQVSAPVFVPQQFHNLQLEHSIVQPHPEYVRQQQMNTRYALPVDQHNYQRNTGALSPNTVMSHSQIIRNQPGRPIQMQQQQQQQQQQQRPFNIFFNQNPQQASPFQKRCISVPVKVSYQGVNPTKIAFSPNKQTPSPVQSKFTMSPIKSQPYQNDRLVTLGDISSGKPQPQQDPKSNFQPKHQRRDHFHLPQLQSKIQLLQSFADNKITTQEFLPNQSHALSNIKWQKGSNSGRDSVTSAFRKDILLQSSNKPSEKKSGEQWRKDDSLMRRDKQTGRIEEGGFYTNHKLLELIKNNKARPYEYPKSNFEERMKKYQKYGRQDTIKEPEPKESEKTASDYYHDLFMKPQAKYTPSSLFSEQAISTPTFGFQKPATTKKKDPYLNKITSITQKWQEENICSTSNGSRGGNLNIHSSNIDQDILEDMHNQGFGMLFKKK